MRNLRHTPTLGPSLRTLAIAGVLLFGNLATLVHAESVRHVTCAEHGELVHVDVAAQVAGGHVGPTDPRESVQDGPTTGGSASHDHCGICVVGRSQTASVERGPRALVASSLEAPQRPVADVRPDGTAVYRFAPKTSPPLRSREMCPTGAPRRDGGELTSHTLG